MTIETITNDEQENSVLNTPYQKDAFETREQVWALKDGENVEQALTFITDDFNWIPSNILSNTLVCACTFIGKDSTFLEEIPDIERQRLRDRVAVEKHIFKTENTPVTKISLSEAIAQIDDFLEMYALEAGETEKETLNVENLEQGDVTITGENFIVLGDVLEA